MPAIQPARLKQQAVLLTGHFDNPPAFVRSLHHLLEFYADRARRPGQAGKPDPMITAYHVRPPVLRQILLELTLLAAVDPRSAFKLCDALWDEPYLEFRLLAAMLLGQIPTTETETVFRRIHAWIRPELEDYLINAVLTYGLVYLREHEPDAMIWLIQNWLASEDKFSKYLGLRALITIVEDPNFENLPVFFRMIQPLARTADPFLRQDLLDVLTVLAHRSPTETAYFLRQTLEMSNATDTPWLIRQCLREFPPEIQTNLRTTVRAISRQTNAGST